jgi:hypothetical protein
MDHLIILNEQKKSREGILESLNQGKESKVIKKRYNGKDGYSENNIKRT